MPVTAKLSRKFYETFGDEIANELVEWFNAVDATYKADLRELNELNFQRFDAKLEQRIAQFDAKLEQRLAQLDAKLELRIAQLDTKLEAGLAGLRTEIQGVKASLLKWMFVTTFTIVGLVFAMLRLMAVAG